MTVYQELQLSSAGSKNLIRNTKDKKEKYRHIFIYNLKVYLVVAFCFAVVTGFSMLFGTENSVAGVVVLLALLVLRQADFGIRTSHGIFSIVLIFTILAVGPRVSNLCSPIPAFAVNVGCILSILVLGCHNVIMCNQSTFVLGYLLLQGYDVSGEAYRMRVLGMAAGMIICVAVFYKNQRGRRHRRTFGDLFREFDIHSARTQWYIRLTLCVSLALLLTDLFRIPRGMWAGIACMSLMLPFAEDVKSRAKLRAPFNILGCGIFLLLYHFLPPGIYTYIGLIGGIGVGYSAGYAWQSVFNTFGALAIAANLYGVVGAVCLRIVLNVFASIYTPLMNWVLEGVTKRMSYGRVAHAE